MSFKSKADAGLSATALCAGDSNTTDANYGYPWLMALALAARYPNHRVELWSRTPGGGGAATMYLAQAGGTGAPVLMVIRDGVPGHTTFRAADKALIFAYPCDKAFIFLGVNDAVNFGTGTTYTPQAYCTNLETLGNYGKQQGAEISLITPAWSEYAPRIEIAGAAWLTRRVAKEQGFGLVDARAIFEAHYTGQNNGGQGNWFPTEGDQTHFGFYAHQAIAQACMADMGYT